MGNYDLTFKTAFMESTIVAFYVLTYIAKEVLVMTAVG